MKQPKFSLEGEVAVVTGAARGIGQAIAWGLAGAGADVAVDDILVDGLKETAKGIEERGRRSLIIEADISTNEGRDKIVKDTLAKFGRIDILVNDAARPPAYKTVLETEEAECYNIMDINLKGLFLLAKAVAREAMIPQKKGSIVNIASITANRPVLGQGAYAVGKAGVPMVTQVLASEWAEHGIRVNAISPRLVKTKMAESIWSDPEKLKMREKMIALGRIALPEDIVGPVIFFASQGSAYVTGQTLIVDGGIGINP